MSRVPLRPLGLSLLLGLAALAAGTASGYWLAAAEMAIGFAMGCLFATWPGDPPPPEPPAVEVSVRCPFCEFVTRSGVGSGDWYPVSCPKCGRLYKVRGRPVADHAAS